VSTRPTRRSFANFRLNTRAAELLREIVGVAANKPSKQEETANHEKWKNDPTEKYHVE
jgi:hypothetical protein